jgi:hypothetical protein
VSRMSPVESRQCFDLRGLLFEPTSSRALKMSSMSWITGHENGVTAFTVTRSAKLVWWSCHCQMQRHVTECNRQMMRRAVIDERDDVRPGGKDLLIQL